MKNKKGDALIIVFVTFMILFVIFFSFLAYAVLTYQNNDSTEIIVDCYDKESSVIGSTSCTRLVYDCNKIQKFLLEDCIGN